MPTNPYLDYYALDYFYKNSLISAQDLLETYVKEYAVITLQDYQTITGMKAGV